MTRQVLLGVRPIAAGLLVLFFASGAAAQTSPSPGLRGKLKDFLTPLGSAQGAVALSSLASLEVSTAPLGTSTGGFTFTFDPLLRIWKRSASSFGPAFSERALTTGKAKVSAGFNFLHAGYNSFDDQDLKNGDFRPGKNITGLAPYSYSSATVNLSSDTIVAYGHVGVTDNFDLGVAVPWISVSLDAQGGIFDSSGGKLVASSIPDSSSSGVGDVAIFGKYRLISQAGGGLAAAVEVRLPTGDKDELRGLDVTRTLVYGIWSRAGRISPHANVGYEFWSHSAPISSDGTIFAKNQVKYAAGVEFEAHPRATVVIDLVGRTVLHGGKVEYQTFPGSLAGTSIDALVAVSKGLNQISLAPGVKWNVWRSVLITANVLAAVSNSGLRANVIPVVGVDWAF